MVRSFSHDPARTEIYTLSLHDALPISRAAAPCSQRTSSGDLSRCSTCRTLPVFQSHATTSSPTWKTGKRSEEHTSELQSHSDLVCRLLLEKKKTTAALTNATHVPPKGG